MLEKFRGMKWAGSKPPATADKTAESAAPATASQGDATDQAALEKALANPAEKIRLQAVLQLEDLTRLLPLCTDDSSEKVRLAAARQYTRFLPDEQDTLDLLNRYSSDAGTRELAKTITGYSPHNRVREHGATLFSAQADLADIAINTRFHDTRSEAIARIDSIAEMDRCWRQIKSKDKIAARDLKTRLDAHHAEAKQAQDRTEACEKLVESMQALSGSVWSPHYANTHAQLHQRWSALDFTPDEQSQRRFTEAEQIARAKVEENAAQQHLHDARERLLTTLEQAHDSLTACETEQLPAAIESTQTCLSQTDEQWRQLASTAAPADTDTQRFQQRHRALSKLQELAKTINRTSNPSADADTDWSKQLKALEAVQQQLANTTTPAFAGNLPAMISTARQALEKQRQGNNELRQSIAKQFGALQGAIRAKRWGPAKSIYERLERKIARLEGRDKPSQLEKLERLGTELKELGDWKVFASQPKLEALCEQMEALPAAGLSPRDQADRIKDLQTQWKSMGASPAQQALWPRFKQAADTAYEPCKKYFAARREEKQSKLDQRAEICDMLEQYIESCDWDNPDWRLVEKTVRTARTEWRNRRVFDRKASKPLDERFDALIKSLNDKLDPVYEANATEKSELIAKVKQLGEGEINQHCINQVKRLQSVWKTGGIMRRKTDQALWKEFNAACGEIFNTHRAHQREQYKSSVEHVTRARAIIDELKTIAKGSTFDEKHLQKLQDEFQQLPEFPERDARYLKRDYSRALNDVDKGRENASDNSRRAEQDRLRHKAQLCEQLEAMAGGTPADLESDITTILDEWQEGDKTDQAEWRKAMNLRRDSIVLHLQNGTLPDYEKNTADRRMLCIELEILLDRETPAEDRNLRRQHQLEKLQDGLTSSATVSKQALLEDLSNQWLCAFPADPALRDSLNSRFNETLGSARKR
jgi:hypothetical protein